MERYLCATSDCSGVTIENRHFTDCPRHEHNGYVNVRKLAAIDLVFLGPKLILAESSRTPRRKNQIAGSCSFCQLCSPAERLLVL